MKNFLFLIALFSLLFSNSLYSQNWCGFIDGSNLEIETPCGNTNQIEYEPGCDGEYRIHVHIIRDNLGGHDIVEETPYVSANDFALAVTDYLNTAFAFTSFGDYTNPQFVDGYPESNISFTLDAWSYIDNNDYFFSQSTGTYDSSTILPSLLSDYGTCGSINIFVGGSYIEKPGGSVSGQAYPSTEIESIGCFVFGDNEDSFSTNALSPILTHELGHLFGLWHTFHNTYRFGEDDFDATGYSVVVDEIDANIGFVIPTVDFGVDYGDDGDHNGDCVRDTYPVPRLQGDDIETMNDVCSPTILDVALMGMPLGPFDVYDAGTDYEIFPCFSNDVNAQYQLNNYMGYTDTDCRTHFTMGQAWRMGCYSTLSPALIRCDLEFDDLVVTTPSDCEENPGTIVVNLPSCLDLTGIELVCPECPADAMGTTFEDLSPGAYTLTIDANNSFCLQSTINVIVPTDDYIDPMLVGEVTAESCPAALDGDIIIQAPFDFFGGMWIDEQGNTTFLPSPADLESAGAGEYTIMFIEGGGCQYSTFTMLGPQQPTYSAQILSSCSVLDDNGIATVSINQESPTAYDYNLFDVNDNLIQTGTLLIQNQQVVNFENLGSGDYTLDVFDLSCSSSFEFTVPYNYIAYEITEILSSNCADEGAFYLDLTAPSNGDVSINWNGSLDGIGGCMVDVNDQCTFYGAEGLSTGEYYFDITTSSGCSISESVVIPDGIGFDFEVFSYCPPSTEGEICVSFNCEELPTTVRIMQEIDGVDILIAWTFDVTPVTCLGELPYGDYTLVIVSDEGTETADFSIEAFSLSANSEIDFIGLGGGQGCLPAGLFTEIIGSNPPFFVEVVDGDGQIVQSSFAGSNFQGDWVHQVLSPQPGPYSITITDSQGCSISNNVTVGAFEALVNLQGDCSSSSVGVSIILYANPSILGGTYEINVEGGTTIDGVFNGNTINFNISPDDLQNVIEMQITDTESECSIFLDLQPYALTNLLYGFQGNGCSQTANDFCFTPLGNYGVDDITYTIIGTNGNPNLIGTTSSGSPVWINSNNYIGNEGISIEITETNNLSACTQLFVVDV
jgi:hypothetical protein